ncbi:hypothetical protein [Coleofasciculus sp. E1-EBD-02]
MARLYNCSLFPVPCSLFPVPCSLFPPLTIKLIQQPLIIFQKNQSTV